MTASREERLRIVDRDISYIAIVTSTPSVSIAGRMLRAGNRPTSSSEVWIVFRAVDLTHV